MARFYGSMQGNRGVVTRIGTPSSGISGHLRGWDVGVRIEIQDVDGHDVIRVYQTDGSNGSQSSDKLIAEFSDVSV